MRRRRHAETISLASSEGDPALTTTFTRTRRSSAGPASLADTRVAEAMHRGVVKCDASAPLSVVARIMAAHRIHCVVVRTAGEPEAWGVVSDLDLVDAVCTGELTERTAGETAGGRELCLSARDTLERAARLMHESRETHVVIVDPRSNAAVGVLSTLDVADALAEIEEEEG
jgi:CBS domain-containing protein